MKVAVFGKIRAGKGLVIETLKDYFEKIGFTTEHLEFSDPVRDVVNTLFPWNNGVKDREVYIKTAQHLRKMNEDIWVDCLRYMIQNSKAEVVFVGGFRQENEYRMLKELGFSLIKVEADEEIRYKRCVDSNDKFERETLKNHTENVMEEFEFDYYITNNATVEELREKVLTVGKDLVFKKHFNETVRGNLIESFRR